MIFVINNLKYDTDKMELISEKCEWTHVDTLCHPGEATSCPAKDVKLYRATKNRWCVTYKTECNKHICVTMNEKAAVAILRADDPAKYEEMFGKLE